MSPPSDADQKRKDKQRSREAEITTGSDGEPLGACIYLTQAELAGLGIDSTKTDRLSYVVEDGQLKVTESEE